MIVKSEAVVLQVRQFGDSSKIAILYSKEYGKISVIAKGAFTAKNKFGGALSPLSYVNAIFYKKSSTDLHLLKEIELIKPLTKLSDNYENLLLGLTTCEFLLNTQLEYSVNEELFVNLVNYLQLLNNSKEENYSLTSLFLFKLSELIGFLVDFSFVKEYLNSCNANSHISFFLDDISIATKFNSNYCYNFKTTTLVKLLDYHKKSFYSPTFTSYLTKDEFIEVAFFFNNFFVFHLSKKFSIKSLSLLV